MFTKPTTAPTAAFKGQSQQDKANHVNRNDHRDDKPEFEFIEMFKDRLRAAGVKGV